MKLKGKVAVITGAGAGYGMSRGFPTIYAQEGADLVLNYYGDLSCIPRCNPSKI